jgi:hypothetical protein
MSVQDLAKMAEQDIINDKRARAGLPPLDPKDEQARKQQEQAKEKTPPQSVQSLVSSMLALLQKIEPKIPQHMMS